MGASGELCTRSKVIFVGLSILNQKFGHTFMIHVNIMQCDNQPDQKGKKDIFNDSFFVNFHRIDEGDEGVKELVDVTLRLCKFRGIFIAGGFSERLTRTGTEKSPATTSEKQ